jgi:hypothetical protein
MLLFTTSKTLADKNSHVCQIVKSDKINAEGDKLHTTADERIKYSPSIYCQIIG